MLSIIRRRRMYSSTLALHSLYIDCFPIEWNVIYFAQFDHYADGVNGSGWPAFSVCSSIYPFRALEPGVLPCPKLWGGGPVWRI